MEVKLNSNITGGDGFPLPDEDFYISSVIIRNNTIITPGDGITLSDARDCEVSGNTINGYNFSPDDKLRTSRDGIRIDQSSKNISVTGNEIKNMPRYGLYITDNSTASAIENNTFKNCTGTGIFLTDSSACIYDIANNIVKNCKAGGILVGNNSRVTNITGNAFGAVSGNPAIKVYSNSRTGLISTNRYVTWVIKQKQPLQMQLRSPDALLQKRFHPTGSMHQKRTSPPEWEFWLIRPPKLLVP